MSNCVVRFGGNSLSDYSILEAFSSLLGQSENKTIVVVSAVEEIQQPIEQGLQLLINSSSTTAQLMEQIHAKVLQKLSVFGVTGLNESLKGEISGLEKLLKGIEFTGDFSLPLKDQVISYSERITTAILHLFLEKKQLDATILYPENLELTVTEEYGNATILFEETEAVKHSLPKGIYLVPGSYGITRSGRIARLGRHSADYSAAAITRLTGADTLELWELEKEFKTCDLDSVTEASLIGRLTYAEASELSYFSEQSINPRIVEPLTDRHIPIHIFRLKDKGKQLTTIINSESLVSPNVVKSVVHTNQIAVLKLNGPGVGLNPVFLPR
jgi:aspartate kinase